MILETQQNWLHNFWIPIPSYIDFTIFIPGTKLAIALELKEPAANNRPNGEATGQPRGCVAQA